MAIARQVILNSSVERISVPAAAHTGTRAAVFHDPRYAAQWEDERPFRRSFWTPTLTLLGIRYRRPYNVRHTYATVMLMAGMTLTFCAKQLGHSVEMFLNTIFQMAGRRSERLGDEPPGIGDFSPESPRESKTDA